MRALILIMLSVSLITLNRVHGDVIRLRATGGEGYTAAAFDDGWIEVDPASTTVHGNDNALTLISESQVGLIGIAELGAHLPGYNGGQELVVDEAVLHLYRFNAGEPQTEVAIRRVTTNWLNGEAGMNELKVSGRWADAAAETPWAGGSQGFGTADYDGAHETVVHWVDLFYTPIDIDVTEIMRDGYETGVMYGFALQVLDDGESAAYASYFTSESPVYQPWLEVTYHYEGGSGLASDFNGDGVVDVIDLGILAQYWQKAGSASQGDTNGDGIVDVIDLGVLAGQWQMTSGAGGHTVMVVAEPGGMAVCTGMWLWGVKRRRSGCEAR